MGYLIKCIKMYKILYYILNCEYRWLLNIFGKYRSSNFIVGLFIVEKIFELMYL